MGDEIDIDLREEPDFLEKSRFKDGRLDLLRTCVCDEGVIGNERLGKVRDLRVDDGVAGALTEVGNGMGELVILCGRCSKGS